MTGRDDLNTWIELRPGELEANRADNALLVDRVPAIRGEIEKHIARHPEVGPHVTYGDHLTKHMMRLAEASPHDEAEIAGVGAFLEEIAADEGNLDNVAELSVIEHILDNSPAASRLFIAERGGPHTRRLAERCAERWDVPLEALWDPTAPRDPDGRPIRTDPLWQRRPQRH